MASQPVAAVALPFEPELLRWQTKSLPMKWVRLHQLDGLAMAIVIATAGAVAYSVALPAMRLYGIIAYPPAHSDVGVALLAFAIYQPVQIWLVLSAARGERRWPQWLGLALVAVVMFASMPFVGVGWVGILYVLAALTLVTLSSPWSLIAWGALVAAPTPLTVALGHGEWALYFTMGTLFFSVPLASWIWMINVARQLHRARLDLASQAVLLERLRIDQELSESIGAGLDSIAANGAQASNLASSDPSGAARALNELVRQARRTLAVARHSVRRFRQSSLRSELETAATLLEAAGIAINLDIPAGDWASPVDDADRATLRREIAQLLIAPAPSAVTIAARAVNGRVQYELRSEHSAS
jgi:two-component system, NarL family, sensor histidine kinase DesK